MPQKSPEESAPPSVSEPAPVGRPGDAKPTPRDASVPPAPASGRAEGSPGGSFGRWKPTIYWYTPIAMVLAAGALLGVLFLIFRRMAREAEARNWGPPEDGAGDGDRG